MLHLHIHKKNIYLDVFGQHRFITNEMNKYVLTLIIEIDLHSLVFV